MRTFKGLLLATVVVPAAASPVSWVRSLLQPRADETFSTGAQCCAAIGAQSKSPVANRAGPGYFSMLYSYWALQESELSPACVVMPTSAQEVSRLVSILTGHNDTQQVSSITTFANNGTQPVSSGLNCQFAIRGGGSTPWAGAANIDDAVTIDLGKINKVTVSSDKKLALIGGGATWGNVYGVLDAVGLAVPGGRVASIGVGGLTLGGGFSFFAPRYGFVCDNVINYELVNSIGKIVNVNQTSDPQLFTALKGGSNNFGIVTRFDIKTFEQSDHWGGAATYADISVAPQMFQAFEAFNSDDYDQYSSLISNFIYVPQFKIWVINNNMQYTKNLTTPPQYNATAAPPVFQPFLDIPGQLSINNSVRVSNMSDFTGELASLLPQGKRELFVTTTVGNSAQLMGEIFGIGNATRESIWNTTAQVFSLTFQPVPRIVIEQSRASANNSLGLNPEDGNQVLVLLTITWSSAAEDRRINDAARGFIDKTNAAAAKSNLAKNWVYLNYAAKWQNPLKSYQPTNLAALQNVSLMMDPTGTFQKLVPGGFKISAANGTQA